MQKGCDASLVAPSRVISRLDMAAYDFDQRHRASCGNHPRPTVDCITTTIFPFI